MEGDVTIDAKLSTPITPTQLTCTQPPAAHETVELNESADLEGKDVYWEQDTSLPPAYDSIFGQFREAKEASGSAVEFLQTAITMFAGTGNFQNVSKVLIF